jgi:hypothetical protein
LIAVLVAAATATICAGGIAGASAGPPEQTGVFSLLGGTPRIVSRFWAEHGAALRSTLNVRQFARDGTPVRVYDTDMEKLIHLVIVRDDFATFAHLHPAFDASTGTFSQPFTKDPNHRYYVYADTIPRGIGQQVFRFTVESDGPVVPRQLRMNLATTTTVGPYTVALSTTTLSAGQSQAIGITVLRKGRPAGDLRTYLGAAAHAVLVNTATLTYVHVHPTVRGAADGNGMAMNMAPTAQAGPLMQLSLPVLPPGFYKLWIQFRGAGNKVFTAPFTMAAR